MLNEASLIFQVLMVRIHFPSAVCLRTFGSGVDTTGFARSRKHHLIIAHQVTGNDRAQLSKMAQQARDASGQDANRAGGAMVATAAPGVTLKELAHNQRR